MNTEPSWTTPWQPRLNWNAPAGKLLDRLAAALPANQPWRIIVFGSSPLQLAFDEQFLSADVDLIASEDIQPYCEKALLAKGQGDLYIDPCSIAAFSAAPDWTFRSCSCQRGSVEFIFPHPIDLLIAKIQRLEDKDLRAFQLVRHATNHPTESDLIEGLRRVVDFYKPSFDEEKSVDMGANTRRLWLELFGREIDVAAEIIRPAIEARKAAYKQPGSIKTILSFL